ncbi:hypothetical protein PHMEG_000916 [Phytophthora megakarya]|uniref:Uncharacterized protein n=1 Tax=Phytophthora megakarya TaxID=4795 RepID=A0A225X1V4_9STRA|nr:hypothetical protein PHMEG_000916 [Phytophthora megakarya]
MYPFADMDDLSYSYSSKPRPVQTNRRTKDNGAKKIAPNIMHDPRIPRGSVFALANSARSMDGREKGKKRRSAKKKSNNNNQSSVLEAQTLPSYGFTAISLEANLIEQTQPIRERESFSQTDEFVPRTVNTRSATTNDTFMRPKIGIDTATQASAAGCCRFCEIEESDGLFNFDLEVKPLLNVLVNKTLAQALVEVKEEQEMQVLHSQHDVLKENKRDEKQAERDLEEKAKEANRRKQVIKQKKAEKQLRDQVMRRKLFAWQFTRPIVSDAMDQAMATLTKKGVFYDPMLRSLARWLVSDVYENADDTIRLRAVSTAFVEQ